MRPRSLLIRAVAILSVSALLPVSASIAGGRTGRGHRGPPQEAVAACADRSEGDACSFEGRRGAMSGTCQTIRSQLACAPEGRARRERGGRKSWGNNEE
jgi:hypothetical protein